MPDENGSKGPDAATSATPTSLSFHFLKSTLFRVIHADGVWGGLTPAGLLHMAFFSERLPLPQVVEHELDANGQIGKELAGTRIIRDGVVRELEVDVIMGLQAAKALRTWLDDKIKVLEQALAEAKARGQIE